MTQCDLPLVVPAVAMKFVGMNSQLDAGAIIDINKTAIATFLSKYFGKFIPLIYPYKAFQEHIKQRNMSNS